MRKFFDRDVVRRAQRTPWPPRTPCYRGCKPLPGVCVMLRDGSIEVYEGMATSDDHGARCEHVHRTLKRIVKARTALDAQEATALRQADRLRLWRHYGYT